MQTFKLDYIWHLPHMISPHSRLLSCGIEQCVEYKCFYKRERHRPFPPRQMNSRRSHVCANGSICKCLCVNRTLIRHSGKQMCVSGRVSQQTNITSHLSVRMETGKQQSSQTQTHLHTRTRSLQFWQTWVMPPTLSLVATVIPHSRI